MRLDNERYHLYRCLQQLLSDEQKNERGEPSGKKSKKSELLHQLLLQEEEENKNVVSILIHDSVSEERSEEECFLIS